MTKVILKSKFNLKANEKRVDRVLVNHLTVLEHYHQIEHQMLGRGVGGRFNN